MEKRSKLKLSAICSEMQLLAQVAICSSFFHWNLVIQIMVKSFLSKMIKKVFLFICDLSTYYKPAIPVLTLCKQISSPGVS